MSSTDAVFRALADPTRRGLFERLCREGEKSVGALTETAGVSQPVVSKHLGLLRAAGLVADRQAGRQTFYRAEAKALAPLTGWAVEMENFWQSRLDDLDDLLGRMDQ